MYLQRPFHVRPHGLTANNLKCIAPNIPFDFFAQSMSSSTPLTQEHPISDGTSSLRVQRRPLADRGFHQSSMQRQSKLHDLARRPRRPNEQDSSAQDSLRCSSSISLAVLPLAFSSRMLPLLFNATLASRFRSTLILDIHPSNAC